MSDDSDDDLLQDSGLSFSGRNRKRRADQKRDALLNIVEYSVDEDRHRRLRLGRLNSILSDHNDVVEQAEVKLQMSAKGKTDKKNENPSLHPDDDCENNNNNNNNNLVANAKEISGFDRLGTRRGVLKQLPRKSLPDLRLILRHRRDNKLLKYLQEKLSNDVLPMALEDGRLVHKFDLPTEFVNWLWQVAVDYESNCREGAYVSLKEYYATKRPKPMPMIEMLSQWHEWFRLKSCDESKNIELPDRDKHDCLLDLHHWLMLWNSLILEHVSRVSNVNDKVVSDIVVELARIPLDTLFYEHNHRRLMSSWCRTVSSLIQMIRSQLKDSPGWNEWVSLTGSRILDIKVDQAPPECDDTDDQDCLLSKCLVVKAFMSADSTFGNRLYEVALGRFLGIDCWNREVSKTLSKNGLEWLAATYKAGGCSREWVLLTYTHCALHLIENSDGKEDNDVKKNPPQLLACIKLIQSFATIGLFHNGDNTSKDDLCYSANFLSWLIVAERQVQEISKFVTRCSTRAHYRRSEVGLLCLKSWIQWHKALNTNAESQSVQKSMTDWLEIA